MFVIGLTGKTGSGKSTVGKLLKEHGFYIVDGDVTAREIMFPNSPAIKALSEYFGKDIVLPDGALDRKLLAKRAFENSESTSALNRITHPFITESFKAEIKKAESDGYKVVIIDAAALLESDAKNLCEKMIVVTAPEEIRLERILGRDNITLSQAKERINAQKSDEYYNEKADIIIRNFPPHNLSEEAERLFELIQKWSDI